MASIDYRIEQLEDRVLSLEDDHKDMINRVQSISTDTQRILNIAEGVQRFAIFIAGAAVFVGALIGIYKAAVG